MAFGKLIQLFFSLCFLQSVLATTRGKEIAGALNYYTIEIDEGEATARNVAKRNGLDYVLPVGNLKGFHILKLPSKRIRKRTTKRSTKRLLKRLSRDPQVKWVEQQDIHEIEKRDPAFLPDISSLLEGDSFNSIYEPLEREKKNTIHPVIFKILSSESEEGKALQFNDPLWSAQWELFNTGQTNGPKGFDINVMPAWKKNITGSGVVVAIIDDGVDHINTDLKKNYDPNASFDFNDFLDDQHDPVPNYADPSNGHGTKCAGEVAMEANNNFCGVGIAYNARIGGIRILDGKVTDALEAAALTYKNNYIDIYSCCWGPKDNGRKLDGPGKLTSKAIREGAEKGRNGKGNIFIWASGNGGMLEDHCGADGYVNSIFTVAVGAVSNLGLSTFYSEACSAVMAVVPTGGASNSPFEKNGMDELDLVTTELDNECTKTFKGTSSAAPMAAGIIALVLEVNPNLTWRDVQHLIVRTCKITDPLSKDWKINGAGYHVHHKYGFGLLDAGRILKEALKLKPMGSQRLCISNYDFLSEKAIPTNGSLTLSLRTNACLGTESSIDTLEHVQVTASMSSLCRGDLSISLTSPLGSVSELLKVRMLDNSKMGLNNWTFMTVHSWGENPRGEWHLTITDNFNSTLDCDRDEKELRHGLIYKFELIFWGTYLDEKQGIQDNARNLLDESNEDLIHLRKLTKENKIDKRLTEEFFYEQKRKVDEDAILYSWSNPLFTHEVRNASAPSSNMGETLLKFWYLLRNKDEAKSYSKRDLLAGKSSVQVSFYTFDCLPFLAP
ncbi:PC3-like endoprotease variant B [Amblyraja radiata]|uniref:PC3-like endoprotease variant B n=1 Tax=Amblyraja radiata TaxID=386614 RepID=UPI001403879D|nr:PC3-like endoprotease variant B [Amblyraja radiata]